MVPILSIGLLMAVASPALAFDTGPHSEITRNALEAEGFGNDAIGVTQVNNWFCDLYEQASSNPFSGRGGWFKRVLSGAVTTEEWPQEVIDAAWRCHFDNVPWLSNTQAETGEWNRLRRAVWTLVQEARDNNDPEELLAVLGISLHQVQDFYSHTNWVEPKSGFGADGPGWQERGYGTSPTWFDVPPSVREETTIYSDESEGHRVHGFWDTDRNLSLTHGMNKDWPGRPYYTQAATAAYFATRQWVEALRSWVNEPVFWAKAQRYHANQGQLSHDLEGMHNISLYSGHWEGQGEPFGGEDPGPGGSVLDLRGAVKTYFQSMPNLGKLGGRTEYRARFQSLIKRVEGPNPSGELAPIPSSQPLQQSTRFVVLRVLSMGGEGVFGLGDPGPDPADLYANVGIDGQAMSSAVIENRDSYSFPKPNAPFTWIKAVPAEPDQSEPVESIEVEVHTADAAWAGTDDDVFLRLGRQRFELDKRLTNDFERGDRDTYSVPIDDAVREGMTVNEITRVEIEKSPDGIAGGWKLGGIKVRVNGTVIADDPNINRWLEDDHRTWWAPDFNHRYATGPKVPVWVNLREDDTLYGSDDEGDINPFDNRDLMVTGYAPGEPPLKVSTHGGNRLGGRLGYGGDGATINYRIETITPETMGSAGSTPPTSFGPLPDLTITSFESNHITIANQGEGAAGPFRLKVARGTIQFPGLAAGATLTKPLVLDCGSTYYATVDDLEQVDETDESNNSTIIEPGIC